MSLEIFSSDTDLPELITRLRLVQPEQAFLLGGRAVERRVGQTALMAARHAFAVAPTRDIDLSLSAVDYRTQRKRTDVPSKHIRHRFPRREREGIYTVQSLIVDDNDQLYDIWRDRWYEPARHPLGIIAVSELYDNSVWDAELGINVPTREYLIAQHQRSVTFLTGKDQRTRTEQTRLAKDQADLTALTA